MAFYTWLKKQDRPDTVGDLAYEVRFDPGFPKTGNRGTYRAYLDSINASSDAVRAFYLAWTEYKSQFKRHRKLSRSDIGELITYDPAAEKQPAMPVDGLL